MQIILMRHGQAAAYATSDADRQLTELGCQQSQQMAERFLSDQHIDTIFVSPYIRAQQTAERVKEAISFTGKSETFSGITPDGKAKEIIKFLSERKEQTILLITHNPFVSELNSYLLSGNSHEGIPMTTSSIVTIEVDVVGLGCGKLLWHHSP